MKKILVIEDEKNLLECIQQILIRFGYKVVTAENARIGIQRFNEDEYHLVITDMVMPEMNGEKIIQHIRSSRKRQTPIIGMSGTPWLFEGMDIDRLLSKPFSLKTLLDTVQYLTCRIPQQSVLESTCSGHLYKEAKLSDGKDVPDIVLKSEAWIGEML